MAGMTSNVSFSEKTMITTTTIGHVIGASFGLVFVLVNSAPLLPTIRIVVCIAAAAMFLVIVAGFVTTLRTTTRGEAEDAVVGFTGRYWVIVGVEAA
jgi:zinc transporter ZupT